jgi:hypothetical protein
MTPCVKLERRDRGSSISSWIALAMNALNAAFAEGMVGYIHWPELKSPRAYYDAAAFRRRANMFDWYFDQPWCTDAGATSDETWVFEDAHRLIERYPIANVSTFFRQHLVFNADVVGRLDALLARYSLAPARAIAIAWRGTDNVTDGRARVPIESFFPAIDRILDAEPDLAIVAKPEERGAAEALLRRYPHAIVPAEFFMADTGATSMQDWISPASGYERGMQAALMILLFSKCRYLLKNNANLSDIATRLSFGHVITWSSPTDWAAIQRPSAD